MERPRRAGSRLAGKGLRDQRGWVASRVRSGVCITHSSGVARRGLGAGSGGLMRSVPRWEWQGCGGQGEPGLSDAVGAVAAGRLRHVKTWGRRCGHLLTGWPQGCSLLCGWVSDKMACPAPSPGSEMGWRSLFLVSLSLERGSPLLPTVSSSSPSLLRPNLTGDGVPVPVQPSAATPLQRRPGQGPRWHRWDRSGVFNTFNQTTGREPPHPPQLHLLGAACQDLTGRVAG